MPKTIVCVEVTIRTNTGNFESVDVRKSMQKEVEYENAQELEKKLAALDAFVNKQAKQAVEAVLKDTGRARHRDGKPIETWGD